MIYRKTGIFLGELTDEVNSEKEPNAYITKFISLGPKNYGYQVYYPNSNKSDYTVKIKGLTLNFSTESKVNFQSMKQLLDDYMEDKINSISVPQVRFTTSKYNDKCTQAFNKEFRLVYDKRTLNKDFTTFPYGYR